MRINPKLLRGIKKAAPAVFTALSVAGVVLTAVVTAKCTIKALEQAEERDDAWKCYIPAALTAIATAACIIGNGIFNHKQRASLMAAYALLSNQYKQYRTKAKEIYGEDANRKIQTAIIEQTNPDNVIKTPGIAHTTTLDWGLDYQETEHLFYESFGKRYFTSTISKVLQAEIALNHNIAVGGFVSINDFYEFLGLSTVCGGEEIGWSLCDCYYFVEFDHYRAKLEDTPDGLEALVIDYMWLPQTEDEIENMW